MSSLFSIFKRGLEKTSTRVTRSIAGLFGAEKVWSKEVFDHLEDSLISADFGVRASMSIVADVRDRYERGKLKSSDDIHAVVKQDVCDILRRNQRPLHLAPAGSPTVILFVGVNGSGKTTTVGKLAASFARDGKKVILGACDTFRAAACEQLALWSDRAKVEIVSARAGADPASVAFDAMSAAVARKADFLLIDTAGRQQTHKNLMDELAKIRRSIAKVSPGAPQEVWLTIDSSLGANAVSQAKTFSESCGVNGLVLTKLDGSGKGGMAVALHQEFQLPTFYVGLGEQVDDLQPFDPELYANAIFD